MGKPKLLRKWPPPKNKLSKASSTKSGRLMMLIRVENSIRKRPRNSSRTPSVTSDPEMNSPAKPSMRSSPPSIRTTPELLRSPRWLSSSSNSSVDNDHLLYQESYNEDQSQMLKGNSQKSSFSHLRGCRCTPTLEWETLVLRDVVRPITFEVSRPANLPMFEM